MDAYNYLTAFVHLSAKHDSYFKGRKGMCMSSAANDPAEFHKPFSHVSTCCQKNRFSRVPKPSVHVATKKAKWWLLVLLQGLS